MKAFVLTETNSFPTLVDTNFPKEENQLELEVLASSANHRDIWITQGMYPGITTGIILGSDAAVRRDDNGIYVINPSQDWGLDKRVQGPDFTVLGMPKHGTFAQTINVDSKYLHKAPSHLDFLEAAALPLAGVTAYRALVTKTQPKTGEKVLINGIGGGVALFAMQFALALGCEVYVTSSKPDKILKAVSLGAKNGYDYTDVNWHKSLIKDIGGVDIIIDSAGGDGFKNLIATANPGARICFYGGTHGAMNGINPQTIFWRQLNIFGSTMGSEDDFKNMLAFVEQHRIKPVIDEVFAFDQLHLGLERMKNGHQFGKIVFDHSR